MILKIVEPNGLNRVSLSPVRIGVTGLSDSDPHCHDYGPLYPSSKYTQTRTWSLTVGSTVVVVTSTTTPVGTRHLPYRVAETGVEEGGDPRRPRTRDTKDCGHLIGVKHCGRGRGCPVSTHGP